MAEFQELIKNFEKIRDYMREFFVYGCKVRQDFTGKSLRTYDKERRRIECFLGDYIRSEYTSKGKQIYISVDSKNIAQNPLYAAWKAKSFTDNDIMLHFFITDILWDGKERTVTGLTDRILEEYGVEFEEQTVRLKLKEYEEEEILQSRKQGKALYYRLAEPEAFESSPLYEHLMDAVKLFQEISAFGFIGSTVLDRERTGNDLFSFKHHYLVHTLEDGVLNELLETMRRRCRVRFENRSARSGRVTQQEGVPLSVFVSTQTGRRYLCIYLEAKRRFVNMRLDAICRVVRLEEYPDYEKRQEELRRNRKACWGVSFSGSSRSLRMEEICLKLRIDEKREEYVTDRLRREGRGGEVLRIDEHTVLYSGTFFDCNEMLPWIKTFTGRILDIQVSNPAVADKLTNDLDRMYQMYTDTAKEG